MLLLIGIPVVDACAGDARGVVACIRDQINQKFSLTGTPNVTPVEVPQELGKAPVEGPEEPQTAPADVLAEPVEVPADLSAEAPVEAQGEPEEVVAVPAAALAAALDTKPVDPATPVADELGAGVQTPDDAAADQAAIAQPPAAIADPTMPLTMPAEVPLRPSDAVAPQIVADLPTQPAVEPDFVVEPPPAAVVDPATPATPAQPIIPAPEPDPITVAPSAPDAEPPAIIALPELAAPDAAPEPVAVDQTQQPAVSSSDVATLETVPGLEPPPLPDEPPVDVSDTAPAPAVLSSEVPKTDSPLALPLPYLDLQAANSPVPELPVTVSDPAPLPLDTDALPANPAAPLEIAELSVAPQAATPANPPADLPPMPPVLQPKMAQPVDPIELSEISPAPPPATPDVVKVPVLAPTIDAIEIEGDSNFVAGDGPEGATVRLYVDDHLVGESPVAGGRWLVEGVDLLGKTSHILRIEAIDPVTGKLLSSAVVSFEIELPKPPAAEPDAPPVAEPEATADPAVVPPASPVIDAKPEPSPVQPPADEIDATTAPLPTEQPERSAEPVAAVDQSAVSTDIADQPTTMPQADDAPAAEDVPQPDELPEISDLSDIVADTPLAVTPEPLPRITPITPAEASASVTILAPLVSDQPTLLPPIAEIDHEPAVQVLPPASVPNLTLPIPRNIPVIRAYPIGDLDAHRFASGKAIIRRGDTLWSIARRYYGHGIHFWTIVHANRDLIRRPSRIYPGQVFALPLVTDE